MGPIVDVCLHTNKVRDGPFDYHGGLGFFLVTRYFYSPFAQQVIFFKSNLKKVSILKSGNV